VEEFLDNDGADKIIADNLIFDGKKVRGKLEFYVFDGIDLRMGNKVCFYALITPVELVDGFNIESSVAVKGIKYKSQVYSQAVTVKKGKLSLKHKINYFIKQRLEVMGEGSDVAYSMLTGDKNNLDGEVYNSFKLCGISHVLAISGLHVGFFVALISFILN